MQKKAGSVKNEDCIRSFGIWTTQDIERRYASEGDYFLCVLTECIAYEYKYKFKPIYVLLEVVSVILHYLAHLIALGIIIYLCEMLNLPRIHKFIIDLIAIIAFAVFSAPEYRNNAKKFVKLSQFFESKYIARRRRISHLDSLRKSEQFISYAKRWLTDNKECSKERSRKEIIKKFGTCFYRSEEEALKEEITNCNAQIDAQYQLIEKLLFENFDSYK